MWRAALRSPAASDDPVTTLTADHRAYLEELQASVREKGRLRPVGGGSKPALSGWGNLMMGGLSGLLEYDPGEYTFTALAGTPVAEVEALLAEGGQELPFDPPLVEAGATLGGTVAAGLSGPGRFRYGGVRDFLLGVTFIDGCGELLEGGGKVVKNAAGFDLPKLMVGSAGCLGVLVEVTFKVFPKPAAASTLRLEATSFTEAVERMTVLAASSFELNCLELEPPVTLWLRLAGLAEALPARLERLEEAVGPLGEPLRGEADARVWREAREFAWAPADHSLVKVPVNPSRLGALEEAVGALGTPVPRRYGVGGNVAYLAWPQDLPEEGLETLLGGTGLSAMAIRGAWSRPLLGRLPGGAFAERVARILDPEGKFAIETRSSGLGGADRLGRRVGSRP
ncbi:MAG: FAD-binding protein [Truepera sp.]|nr:FAD-binding protein [Truepera sp.]